MTPSLLFNLQAFSYLQSTEKLSKFFHSIIQNVQVFARVAPKQKVEQIFQDFSRVLATRLWALSIQPKIPVISVATSNGTDHFGLV